MLSWFTTSNQPNAIPTEVPQISRSLEPIKEDAESLFVESSTASNSASSSIFNSLSGYWSSSTSVSPNKRLSISRQTSIVIPQPGAIYSDLSQIPPGVEVEYVDVKEEQSGIWDFINHVVSGDEDGGTENTVSPSVDVDEAHLVSDSVELEHTLQESPRRRNSIGGSGNVSLAQAAMLALKSGSETPVQETAHSGYKTPVIADILQSKSDEVFGHCILCGRRSQTIHTSRSRMRSV